MAQVPLKLRKQMLLMRAAVERVELAHHILEVRQAVDDLRDRAQRDAGRPYAQPRVAGVRR